MFARNSVLVCKTWVFYRTRQALTPRWHIGASGLISVSTVQKKGEAASGLCVLCVLVEHATWVPEFCSLNFIKVDLQFIVLSHNILFVCLIFSMCFCFIIILNCSVSELCDTIKVVLLNFAVYYFHIDCLAGVLLETVFI